MTQNTDMRTGVKERGQPGRGRVVHVYFVSTGKEKKKNIETDNEAEVTRGEQQGTAAQRESEGKRGIGWATSLTAL